MIPWSPTASSPSSEHHKGRLRSARPEQGRRQPHRRPHERRNGLLQRREGGRQEDLVLLRQQPVRSSWWGPDALRSEEHGSELQSRLHLVCRLLLEKKKKR